ncbi:hypothetical protein OG259_40075 [Streptomyces sp. NBC_00250]|uniref:hypothetical protein n=1 Tax=Streptomyces sp. NBC_00250 TaxID=2903641 RepID=UPI002E2C0FF4|nr:hypothetical protein [Streptomyces sp. NBC_00250]
MRRTAIARILGSVTAALGLTIGFTGQAAAISHFEITHVDTVRCIGGYSETSAGSNGGGYSVSRTHGFNRLVSGACQVANQPVGSLSSERHILAFDMQKGVWWKCAGHGPARNSVPAVAVELYGNINRACGGDVWYATNTAAYGWDGGAWRGRWVVSGNHWVPRSGFAPTAPPPAPSISAAEAVRRGEVRLGSPTGPKANAAQLQAPPREAGSAPVTPQSVSDGTYAVRTITR